MAEDDEHRREFLLAALRAASIRAKLMDAELSSIGIALKSQLITVQQAVNWIHDEGLMALVSVMPDVVPNVEAVDSKPTKGA